MEDHFGICDGTLYIASLNRKTLMKIETIKTLVEITNNQTGQTVKYEDDDGRMEVRSDGSKEFWSFNWSEGNFGCDCNRCLFFERALGREPKDEEITCGEDKYRVRIFDLNGQLLYEDDR